MDIIKPNTPAEIEALLMILAEWERQELMLLMLDHQEAESEGARLSMYSLFLTGYCLKSKRREFLCDTYILIRKLPTEVSA